MSLTAYDLRLARGWCDRTESPPSVTIGWLSTKPAEGGPSGPILATSGGNETQPTKPFATKTMRKIERLMNAAITKQQDFKLANTMVQSFNGVSHVFLHGNKIAEVGENFIVLMDGGWQSNTTKSRLNAILSAHGCPGECVFQKNFEWFVAMNGTTVPFFSGMRLN